ncbi:hypothetical protein LO80_01735 [Candidatus Francisella endociliophora]|uniref:VirK protein n=1 Tax=Candidatus Francisella endociliophora TaxID=653937 RepID=A0A097EMM5_9GAMM|nr:VirK family protein [Francisella sp. FSC1006]AIT08821.1 hypothetical protein LO80_01735 [Francisella sp. FSC1006]
MKLLYKLAAIVGTFSFFSCAVSQELKSYDDINKAVKLGNQITLVFSLNKCEVYSGTNDYTEINGYIRPTTIMNVGNRIVFSQQLLNDHHIESSIPVIENNAYSINNNDEVEMTFRVLDAQSYKEINGMTKKFICKLGNAAKVYS